MAWKPKTIVGKILKGTIIGVGIAGAAIGGAALLAGTGGAAAPAVVSTGGGLLSKIFKGAKKVVDVVGTKAKDLVSGVTAEQRVLIAEQKDDQRADVQKINAIQKLIRAGATVEEAAAKVGVPLIMLKGLFGIPSDTQTQAVEISSYAKEISLQPATAGISELFKNKTVLMALAGVAALFLLPKLLKSRR